MAGPVMFATADQDDVETLARHEYVGTEERPLIDGNGRPWHAHMIDYGRDGVLVFFARELRDPAVIDLVKIDTLVEVYGPVGFTSRTRTQDAPRWTFVNVEPGVLDTRVLEELDPMEVR